MSDVPTYGTLDNPFPETPQAATLKDVHWAGGMAVQMDVPSAYVVFVKYDPAMDTSIGSLSCWLKVPEEEASGGGVIEFDYQFAVVPGVEQGSFYARIVFQDSPDTGNFIVRENSIIGLGNTWTVWVPYAAIDYGEWISLQMSWDAPEMLCTIALNGAPQEVQIFAIHDAPVPTRHTARQNVVAQVGFNVVAYYDVWISKQYIDFDNRANIARFISPDKKPVPLGAEGKLGSPTERRPEFFFHCNAGDDPKKFFTGNLGTEGMLAAEGPAETTYKKVAKPTMAGEP